LLYKPSTDIVDRFLMTVEHYCDLCSVQQLVSPFMV
jgi:hypothetical protein